MKNLTNIYHVYYKYKYKENTGYGDIVVEILRKDCEFEDPESCVTWLNSIKRIIKEKNSFKGNSCSIVISSWRQMRLN